MKPYKTRFHTLAEMPPKVGKELGLSDWFEVTQERINDFAIATLDEQWIHIDKKKAEKLSPFGTTIAHGFLILSLAPNLVSYTYEIENLKMGINYGTDKVRFTNPVKSGSMIRVRSELMQFDHIDNGAKIKVKATFEIKGQEKPACIAELIAMVFV